MFLQELNTTKPFENLKEASHAFKKLEQEEKSLSEMVESDLYRNAILDFNYNSHEAYLNESFNFSLEDFLYESGDDHSGAIHPNSAARNIALYGWSGAPKDKGNQKPANSNNNSNANSSQGKEKENSKENPSSTPNSTSSKKSNSSNSKAETGKELKDKGKLIWNNVKAFAKNVWEKIKELCKLIARKVKEWTSNVLDLFNSKETEIQRSDYELLQRLPRVLEKALAIASKSLAISEGGVERLQDQVSDVSKEIESVVNDSRKKNGVIKVGKNWLRTMSNVISQLTTKLNKGNDLLQKQLTQVERAASKVKSNDVQGDAQNVVAFYNKIAVLFRTVASRMVEVSNALLESIKNRKESDNENDADKELKEKYKKMIIESVTKIAKKIDDGGSKAEIRKLSKEFEEKIKSEFDIENKDPNEWNPFNFFDKNKPEDKEIIEKMEKVYNYNTQNSD